MYAAHMYMAVVVGEMNLQGSENFLKTKSFLGMVYFNFSGNVNFLHRKKANTHLTKLILLKDTF